MKSRPVRVGLTGGIGSGKSTVLRRFAELGLPVESADAIVHRLYATPGTASRAIARLLGEDVLRSDGSVDRAVVRAMTFVDMNDPPATRAIKDTRRLQLMAVLDPFIWYGLLTHEMTHAHSPWIVWEVPLLLEAGWEARVDSIVVVDCAETVQVERVKARNGWSAAVINGVMARQASRPARLALANDVLHGDQPQDALIQQVDRLVQTWRQRCTDRVDDLLTN